MPVPALRKHLDWVGAVGVMRAVGTEAFDLLIGRMVVEYIVDQAGSVVTIHEPFDGETTIRPLLRYLEGEGVLETLDVVG
jgi:hypothetical protein